MARALLRAHDWLVNALAAVAGAIVVAIFLAVVYDATLRNLGMQPPRWTVPSSEFGLFYITLLAGPWLLRTNGHVVVESLRAVLPAAAKSALEHLVYAGCIVVCAVIAWFALDQAIDAWVRGEADLRAIRIPLYVAYAPMVLGFALMGCEFARLLFGQGSLYAPRAGDRDGM